MSKRILWFDTTLTQFILRFMTFIWNFVTLSSRLHGNHNEDTENIEMQVLSTNCQFGLLMGLPQRLYQEAFCTEDVCLRHGPRIERYPDWPGFFYLSTKTYAFGVHWKHLRETLPMGTKSLCFHQEIYV